LFVVVDKRTFKGQDSESLLAWKKFCYLPIHSLLALHRGEGKGGHDMANLKAVREGVVF